MSALIWTQYRDRQVAQLLINALSMNKIPGLQCAYPKVVCQIGPRSTNGSALPRRTWTSTLRSAARSPSVRSMYMHAWCAANTFRCRAPSSPKEFVFPKIRLVHAFSCQNFLSSFPALPFP